MAQVTLGEAKGQLTRWSILSLVILWFNLVVMGWLAFSLIQAISQYIRFGLPWYDWQWYLGICFLLLGFGSFSLINLLRWRVGKDLGSLLLIWLILGWFGFWQRIVLLPTDKPKVPIAFWTGVDIFQASEETLNEVSAAGGILYVSMGPTQISGEKKIVFIEGMRRLGEHGIHVYLNIQASDYLSVPVQKEWNDNVLTTAAVIQEASLNNIAGFLGDAEHPLSNSWDLFGLDRSTFHSTAQEQMKYHEDFSAKYSRFKLGITTSWFLFTDNLDGDEDISIAARCPVLSPEDWDFVTIMIYSSYFPSSWRAYYVYLIESILNQLCEYRKPGYLIGLAVRGSPEEPELSFEDLARDARLSRAMGAHEIVIFKLNQRSFELHGEDFISRLYDAVNLANSEINLTIPLSRPASILVFGTIFLDLLFDLHGVKGYFIFVWLLISIFLVNSTNRKRLIKSSRINSTSSS